MNGKQRALGEAFYRQLLIRLVFDVIERCAKVDSKNRLGSSTFRRPTLDVNVGRNTAFRLDAPNRLIRASGLVFGFRQDFDVCPTARYMETV